jgi:uncharacterized protein
LTGAGVSGRLQSLDTIRGVAVMGILLLNILAFAMPRAAYLNPHAYGGAEGIDLAIYLVNFVLFDGKMRGLFSFLFGASILLVIERAEAKGEDAARVHFARMGWLLAFGLAHLWLVWWGDILSLYAPIGMLAWHFRRMDPGALVARGLALLVLQSLLMALVFGLAAYAVHGVHSPDPEQAKSAARAYAGFNAAMGVPPPDKIAADLALHRGPYGPLLATRLRDEIWSPLASLWMFGCETLAYMLFGMAALKAGLLAGEWPRTRYWRWLAIGFGTGIPAYLLLAAWLVSANFSVLSVAGAVLALPTLFRPAMILGWACLIVLAMRPGGWLTTRIAATGRMAFTNYLATSLICTAIFYGHGLGWYGHLSRAELYLVVPCVWAAMLLWSKPWLDHFRFGPFEWLWRSLARARLQPIRGAAA